MKIWNADRITARSGAIYGAHRARHGSDERGELILSWSKRMHHASLIPTCAPMHLAPGSLRLSRASRRVATNAVAAERTKGNGAPSLPAFACTRRARTDVAHPSAISSWAVTKKSRRQRHLCKRARNKKSLNQGGKPRKNIHDRPATH